MVGLPTLSRRARATRPLHSRKAATRTVRRRFVISFSRTWPGWLWAMAVLSLLLLPAAYRAGAAFAHPHSLFQLWLDAADGTVHHHDGEAGFAPTSIAPDWFDPTYGTGETAHPIDAGSGQPDIGSHENSAPTVSALHLLLAAAPLLAGVGAARAPAPVSGRQLAGRSPRIPFPPPRPAGVAD
jgi:hypothetical protein